MMSSNPRRILLAAVLVAVGCLVWVTALFVGEGDLGAIGASRIGRVDVLGMIVDSEETVERITELDGDDSVAAILVRIDSPGGGVGASQEIFEALMNIRRKQHKKIVASIGGTGASGGYYVAAAADRIYANPGSLVGSIGVIFETAVFEELMRKVGVQGEVIKSGKFKDTGSPLRRMTAEERALLQGVIDDAHLQFVQAVSEGRRVDVARVAAWADGRIYTGAQGKKLGLIDELGGLEEAIRGTARLVGIEGKPEVAAPRKRWSLKELITSRLPTGVDRLLTPLAPSGMQYLWRP